MTASRCRDAMRVLLTGGAGDLGVTLVPRLLEGGDTPVVLDVRAPSRLRDGAVFIQGSILDRANLPGFLAGCDAIVHIAAWHGIHESNREKDAYDFFDLNVRGTFEVFEAASRLGIDKVVHISTTSVHRADSLYARSKILAERIAEDYRRAQGRNVVTLRARGFIPHWNRAVYTRYSDWARWFWRGAVHIDDVAMAVQQALALLCRTNPGQALVLPLDSAYDYTADDLACWDVDGPGSTFRKYYDRYFDLAVAHGLDPAARPFPLDITETIRWLGYRPRFGLRELLVELEAFGDAGPPGP